MPGIGLGQQRTSNGISRRYVSVKTDIAQQSFGNYPKDPPLHLQSMLKTYR